METSLIDLPPELVVRIIEYLPGQDIGQLSQTCSLIREICRTEIIWMRLCFNICEIDPDECGTSWYDIYTKVLYRYGRCIGLWRRVLEPYGGLVKVQVEEGRLIGKEYHPPIVSDIHGPLRIRNGFSIGINKNTNKTEILCLRGYFGPHPGSFEFVRDTSDVKFKCCQKSCHAHPKGSAEEFQEMMQEETGNNSVPFTGYDKARLDCYINQGVGYYLTSIKIQPTNPVYPIQPGLFMAHYSAHGIEMFLLEYSIEDKQAKLLKITGDPNVPSGQASIFVLLDKPLNLTPEQQTDIDYIMNLEYDDIPNIELRDVQPLNQRFLIPPSFETFAGDFNATTCKYRFLSKGQVANIGFQSPQCLPGHFTILSENYCMKLWIDFSRAYLFIRLTI